MKMPIHCPACNHIMINNYIKIKGNDGLKDILKKECNHGHSLVFIADIDESKVLDVMVKFVKTDFGNMLVSWNFYSQKIKIMFEQRNKESPLINTLSLSWFEPDLSNLQKLFNKIKTYIVFS